MSDYPYDAIDLTDRDEGTMTMTCAIAVVFVVGMSLAVRLLAR